MNFLRSCKLLVSVTIFLSAIGLLLMVIRSKINEIHSLYQEDVETLLHLRWLLEAQRSVKDVSGAGKAIIMRQSLMNALETGNASHLFPIPLNERKRTVIFSSWRSGSTFIGDIYNNLPGNYYHYEPFNYRGVGQVKTDENSIAHVKNLLNCKYGTPTTTKHMNVSGHWHYNIHITSYCGNTKEQGVLCRSVPFREAFCHIFPRQNMKLVRARVTLAEAILDDPELNVNAILQVRDPRAVHLSRKTLGGCSWSADCYSMQRYCKYLVDDYNNAKPLLEKYPKRFKVIRFEDLALNPFEMTKEMFDQFEIPFDERIQEFLEVHTKAKKGGIFSTFRDSKAVVSKWMQQLNMSEVTQVQSVCLEAMKLWGYNFVQDESQLASETFDPVDNFSM